MIKFMKPFLYCGGIPSEYGIVWAHSLEDAQNYVDKEYPTVKGMRVIELQKPRLPLIIAIQDFFKY